MRGGRPHVGNVREHVFAGRRLRFSFGGGSRSILGSGGLGSLGGWDGHVGPVLSLLHRQRDQGPNLRWLRLGVKYGYLDVKYQI